MVIGFQLLSLGWAGVQLQSMAAASRSTPTRHIPSRGYNDSSSCSLPRQTVHKQAYKHIVSLPTPRLFFFKQTIMYSS